MKRRITVSLDEKLLWTPRNKQIELILKKNQQIGISSVVNLLFYKAITNDEMVNTKLNSVMPSDEENSG